VVLAGGDAFLANRIDESFAIVQTGVPDLDVYAENRPVARTNKNGKALVPTLKSYQRNKVSIDPRKLPLNATIATTQEVLTPPDRSGVMVDFGIETDVRSAVVIFDEPTGRLLQAGLRGKTANGRSSSATTDEPSSMVSSQPMSLSSACRIRTAARISPTNPRWRNKS